MANVEDRLRVDIRRLSPPGDAEGVVEQVLRRATRRRATRRLATVALALAVAAGTIAATWVLVKVFPRSANSTPGTSLSPYPITPHANGLIAYASGGAGLATITPGGSNGPEIPTPPGETWLLAWSPDGTEIAVTIFHGEGEREIWVMNADGSEPRRIASADNVSRASWSPDGSALAYAAALGSASSIHVVDEDGSNDRVLYRIDRRGRDVFSAEFSPDGTQILFDQGTDSGFGIFLMDADGSNVRRLTQTGHDYDPHWSPDGAMIAFTRQGVGPQSDIYVMDADGSNVRQLTHGGQGETNLSPTWAPDGTKIAYEAGKNGGPGGLVVMDPDGSDPVTLIKDGVLDISWQPLPIS